MMKAVTVQEMRALEKAAGERGSGEASLMGEAAHGIAKWIHARHPRPGILVIYLGKGHNAGDAILAAQVLRHECGWKIIVRAGFPARECAPLTAEAWQALDPGCNQGDPPNLDFAGRPRVILDGLLGIGGSGPLRAPLASLAREMQDLARTGRAELIAIDVPSGLNADSGNAVEGAVRADFTLMLGAPKIGLLDDDVSSWCGSLALIPMPLLGAIAPAGAGDAALIAPCDLGLAAAIERRPYQFHKGLAGRVTVVAGTRSFEGAAALCASAAARAGAGLVTLLAPADAFDRIRGLCPPEVMILDRAAWFGGSAPATDAWVVGPGLGNIEDELAAALDRLLETPETPVIWDADGLNWLAKSRRLGKLRPHHILTPHPGEFRRLAPDLAKVPRSQAVAAWTSAHHGALLLKGARTVVGAAGEPCWHNSTGSPGMASGGMGDTLAGVIGALLAVGTSPPHAAAIAAWLCGHAAELAILGEPGRSPESLLASDLADHLGEAWNHWFEASR